MVNPEYAREDFAGSECLCRTGGLPIRRALHLSWPAYASGRIILAKKWIEVTGAREHNLKNVDVRIPRDALTIITGLSGSGKSSLAFDTIYAEGQRKYVESLSAYARQFLGQMQKPDVDAIEGLSPAVSIEQRTAGSNQSSRSTRSGRRRPSVVEGLLGQLERLVACLVRAGRRRRP